MFLDVRGPDRALRVTTHADEGVVVLSIWHGDRCSATFRLPVDDCARLIAVLASSLGDQLVDQRTETRQHGEAGTADG